MSGSEKLNIGGEKKKVEGETINERGKKVIAQVKKVHFCYYAKFKKCLVILLISSLRMAILP